MLIRCHTRFRHTLLSLAAILPPPPLPGAFAPAPMPAMPLFRHAHADAIYAIYFTLPRFIDIS